MASRSGGTPIRTRKVKPGPDQAFTLQKGTSAAPIMQVKVKPKPKPKKPKKSKKQKLTDALDRVLNKPIFRKALQKDIKEKGKTVIKGEGTKISKVPSSTPVNPNKVTWREWKDASKRDLLETTPAHLITTAVVPPAIIGGSVGAAALIEKVLGKKDKKKEKKLKKNKGGLINSRAIAKKYFRGGLV